MDANRRKIPQIAFVQNIQHITANDTDTKLIEEVIIVDLNSGFIRLKICRR